MSKDSLHTFVDGEYIGRFERNVAAENPKFVYELSANQNVSLSLQKDAQHDPRAAKHFLEGLVPESRAAKAQIQELTNAESTEAWDLLAAIGGDLPGGIILLAENKPDALGEPLVRQADEREIAARIISIKNGGTGYDDPEIKPRFSLAGAQGKFALAAFDGDFYWSDAATPSTHVLKPEGEEHPGLELVEAATLELARRAGLEAPFAEQLEFAGETSYSVERFDRKPSHDGLMQRLHMEDATQALGRPVGDKYQVHTDDIVGILRSATGSDELGYEFYCQYVFNTLIGNADAHAKNYSLMLGRDGAVTLSPLYDSIPAGMFDGYKQALSMPVGWNEQFRTLTLANWDEAFLDSGLLDQERLRHILTSTGESIQEHLGSTFGAVDHPVITEDKLNSIRMVIERSTGADSNPITLDLKGTARTPAKQPRGGKQSTGKAAAGAGGFDDF